jgi:hypothetical protein
VAVVRLLLSPASDRFEREARSVALREFRKPRH